MDALDTREKKEDVLANEPSALKNALEIVDASDVSRDDVLRVSFLPSRSIWILWLLRYCIGWTVSSVWNRSETPPLRLQSPLPHSSDGPRNHSCSTFTVSSLCESISYSPRWLSVALLTPLTPLQPLRLCERVRRIPHDRYPGYETLS